ncbi:hypothetical protein HNP55_000064 [Paucibacter oligotrophus]|uniref:Uncharacterized protein n=1 Tax=Roseateles oligotrophus TaxID=1769250 RepID=A0A840L5V7_9BURK|nr:hypothetical protein [Roseateles oligotrophus]MBB4841569.1 hypothetical protein [Roseateles oligotrophus]
MSAAHRVVPTLTEVVDESVLEGREPRPAALSRLKPEPAPMPLDEATGELNLLDLSDLSAEPSSAEVPVLPLSDMLAPGAAQFLARLPELSLDLPDLSLRLQSDGKAEADAVEDLLADTRAPEPEDEGLPTRLAALPAEQELALARAIEQAVDDALDEVLDQVLEKAVLTLRAQLHGSVRAAVLRRLREQADQADRAD